MAATHIAPAPRAQRLALALEAGLTLPDVGRVALLHPGMDELLPALPQGRLLAITPLAPVATRLAGQGLEVHQDDPPPGSMTAALVCLPRSRAEALDLIARACRMTTGPVIVDGQKTDGIEPVLKALRERVALQGPIAKGHGKIAWFDAAPLADWLAPPGRVIAPDGTALMTLPGVFSADGIDPASALLAEAVPASVQGVAVDLGAGWGWLAARLLNRSAGITALHLIEADARALDCARKNVTDARARFLWADATALSPATTAGIRADLVVMNPPFHLGRSARPALGAGFIAAAAALLKPSGTLWMVANRHLPYEATLAARFRTHAEVGGDSRFKLFRAEGPVTEQQAGRAQRTLQRKRLR